jgi:acetate kinase
MDGLDAVVFTAGIGENNKDLRRRVCENMNFFGIKINNDANNVRGSAGTTKISADDSAVAVYMIPTNEELVIAKDTEALAKSVK